MPKTLEPIIVLGDINLDILGATDGWPQPGEDCQSRELELHLGGVAANCALAISQWGLTPRLVGCVGRDEFGRFLRRQLRRHELDIRWIQNTAEAMTGLCYINVTPDGQRTFFGSRGASRFIQRPPEAQALLRGAAGLHLVGYNFIDPVTEATARFLLKQMRGRGAFVALDVGPEPAKAIPQKILQAAAQADILFLNREEARMLTLENDARTAFKVLIDAGVSDVVLKLGKDGCLIADEGKATRVPSFDVKVVDSTGAGDAFVAAFLQARMRGWSKAEAALAANAAGAAAVTVMGAGEKLPSLNEIARVLAKPVAPLKWEDVRRRTVAKVKALRRWMEDPEKPRKASGASVQRTGGQNE